MAKNKQKTKKSLLRRFKITKNGTVLRRQGFNKHLKVKKSANKKRSLNKMVKVVPWYAKKVRKVLGK